MNGKVFSYVLTALIGFAIAMAYYELGPGQSQAAVSDTDQDPALVGTLEIESQDAQGYANLYEGEGSLILELDMATTGDSELQILWDNKDLEFKSISNQAGGSVPGFLFANGQFGMSSSSEKKLRIELSMPDRSEAGPDNEFQFIISQSRRPLFQGTLSPQ